MDDPFGNALVIEVRDFFTHGEVFQQRRAARAGLQRVLVVGDFHALVRAQRLPVGLRAELFEVGRFGVVAGGAFLAGLDVVRG